MSNIHLLYNQYLDFLATQDAHPQSSTSNTNKQNSETVSPQIQAKKTFFSAISSENINELDDEGRTLLHLACDAGDDETVYFLLQNKAKTNITDGVDFIAFDYALLRLDAPVLAAMIEFGADIDKRDLAGYTMLEWKILGGDLDNVTKLLELGANIHKIKRDVLTHSINEHITDQDKKSAIFKLLFSYGLGIGFDFHGITLPPGCTKNAVLINTTINRQPVDNKHPNINDGIFTVEEFKSALNNDIKFNLQYLLLATNLLVTAGIKNPELISFKDLLINQLKTLQPPQSLRQNMIRDIAKKLLMFPPVQNHALKQTLKNTLPTDLTSAITEAAQTEIQTTVLDQSLQRNTKP